ncbi:MAG: hypothetical protein MJZ81_06375 [Bacteroidales bacterium]|nr:hypothetical protein [Bacteroidales bacterium]
MITEMNCSPDPQWLKDFKKEIQEEYKLTSLDAACIAGKVAKIVRKRDDKACEWLEENAWIDGTEYKFDITDFRKAMEE